VATLPRVIRRPPVGNPAPFRLKLGWQGVGQRPDAEWVGKVIARIGKGAVRYPFPLEEPTAVMFTSDQATAAKHGLALSGHLMGWIGFDVQRGEKTKSVGLLIDCSRWWEIHLDSERYPRPERFASLDEALGALRRASDESLCEVAATHTLYRPYRLGALVRRDHKGGAFALSLPAHQQNYHVKFENSYEYVGLALGVVEHGLWAPLIDWLLERPTGPWQAALQSAVSQRGAAVTW
jgi:hypothetical protein